MSDQAKEQRQTEQDENAAAQAGLDQSGDYEVVVRLMKENEDMKDRLLRGAAEMENLRRRTAREMQDARAYSIAGFARDMLSVSDNLRRALDAVPADRKDAGDPVLSTLIEGVGITERAMLSTLERHGVKKLEPKGERFDPNFHQAIAQVPDQSVPAGTVIDIVQPGFSIGERVLRPAMVTVSAGGPKPAAPAGPAEPGAANAQAENDA